MTPIARWLHAHGLSAYIELFERELIDLDALPHLADADLKALGLPTGPRVKLLAAAAELKQLNPLSDRSPSRSRSSDHHEDALVRDAERRQLTILFCDLVGSTALSQELDPEALRELMKAYQQTCGAVIEKYEGHVAQYLGDGLMVYFGWPHAHEDDAERAVRSALELVQTVKRVPAPAPLQIRIGITTGLVVVGETGDGDASVPKLAVGETPNLAARLQGLAGPDQIVIGPTTHRLLGGMFVFSDLGTHTLKGIVGPVQAFAVTGLGKDEGRFEAARAQSGLTPMVGREEELSLLLHRWEQAKTGEGQVVLLSGEPGIGKSRIVQALCSRIAAESHSRLRAQCSPFHTSSALRPIVEMIERAARFERDDTADRKLDKLEHLLAQASSQMPTAPALMAALLSLPVARYPALALSPQQQKDKTMAVLAEQVAGLSKKQPVLLLFEDAHWSDPTTRELLDILITRLEALPVLLLITFRPQFNPPWVGQPQVTSLTLARLNKRQASVLIERVAGQRHLPAEVLSQILAKTDGVPLFLEELTKTVLESGLLEDTIEGYKLNDAMTPPRAVEQVRKLVEDEQVFIKPAGLDKSMGLLTSYFGKDLGTFDSQSSADAEVQEFLKWRAKYLPDADPSDGAYGYAYMQAALMVEVLKRCGNDLTRENVMHQAANLKNLRVPMFLDGITVNTSATDFRPIKQMRMLRFDGQRWNYFGPIMTE